MQALFFSYLSRLAEVTTGPIYLVGGTIRDVFLRNSDVRDIDVIMPRGSDRAARAFADAEGGIFFVLDDERHVSRVLVPHAEGSLQFDFADFEGDDLESDLDRRDFTMNAIAVDLREYLERRELERCALIDRHGGLADIGRRIIRVVHPRVLNDDPLRMLRAVRFAATLGFALDPETADEIRQRTDFITLPSPERLRDELFLILSVPAAGRQLLLLDSLGLLERLLPELKPLRGFAPGKHHSFDILTHSIKTADYAEQSLEDMIRLKDSPGTSLRTHLHASLEQGITRMAALRFACLLHDLAKAETVSRDESGDVHFHGHDQAGADRVRDICTRFRLSKATGSLIERLVRNHMRLFQLSRAHAPSRRALYRYCRDLKDAVPESIVLSLADGMATFEAMPAEDFQDTGATAAIVLEYYNERYLKTEERPLVTGRDLLAMGYPPGPYYRMILDTVKERQAGGSVSGRQEALDLAKKLLGNKKEKARNR